MRKTIGIGIALTAAAASGCGGKAGSGGPSVSVTSSTITIDTGKFTIPAGESFTCIYTGIQTDAAYSVTAAQGHQGPGGHHITAYYSNQAPKVDAHPCTDSEMLNWNFIAAAGAEGNAIQFLPTGLALKIPKGPQLVIQSHYINTSGASQTVDDQIILTRIDPSQVQAYAASFVVVDSGFSVPPGSVPYQHSLTCSVPQNLQIAMMLGHEHTHGTHFNLSSLGTGSAGTATVLYDTPWQPSYMSHPPVQQYQMSRPLLFTQGEQLQVTCSWLNDTSAALNFPDEMCVSFMYYWPDTGAGMQYCM